MQNEVRIKRKRGGQPGNANRLVHGAYAEATIARRKEVMAMVRDARVLVAEAKLVVRVKKPARRSARNLLQSRHCTV